MNILFLDDCPQRTKKFRSLVPSATTVSTAQECIDLLRTKEWDWIFLDHDLGGETYQDSQEFNTGMQVVREMISEPVIVKQVVVHSLNYDAARTMISLLRESNYTTIRCSFLDIKDFVERNIC
jgi:hypothetical protein